MAIDFLDDNEYDNNDDVLRRRRITPFQSAQPSYDDVPDAPTTPGPPPHQQEPFGSPEQEYGFADPAFRSHVSRTDYLKDRIKEEDFGKAWESYQGLRWQGRNRGDAVNQTISGFGWDDPRRWMATTAPSQTQPPTSYTASGNPEADFFAIYGNKPPSGRTLEQYFGEFQRLYPGSRLKKNASGYADAIYLPDGTIVDTQRNSGYERSDAWQWNVVDPFARDPFGGDSWGPNTNTTIPGLQSQPYAGNTFDDPSTKYLEDLLKERLAELSRPVEDPNRAAYAQLLERQRALYDQQLIEARQANEAATSRRASTKSAADRLLAIAQQRQQELSGVPSSIQDSYNQLKSYTQRLAQDFQQVPPELLDRFNQFKTFTSGRAQELQQIPPEILDQFNQFKTYTAGRAQELQQVPQEILDQFGKFKTYTTGRAQELQQVPQEILDQFNQFKTFASERAEKLKGPAYTGTEQEILRTQALDPIEQDRQAARQRAIHNIASRGFDLNSGIAQDLINQVDREFDRTRAGAQGDLAYRQVQEQRSREQEAQALLDQLTHGETQMTEYGRGRQQESQALLDLLARGETQMTEYGRGRQQESQALLDLLSTGERQFSEYGRGRQQESQALLDLLARGEAQFTDYQTTRQRSAQDLLGYVSEGDRAYTDYGDVRGREAQQLQEYLTQIPDAIARGDLDFVNRLSEQINQPSQGAIRTQASLAGLSQQVRAEEEARRAELMARASQLYELPMNAAQLGMSALGQAPNPASLTQQTLLMQQLAQQREGQNAQFWAQLGASMAPFFT